MPSMTSAHVEPAAPVVLSVGGFEWLFSIVTVKRVDRSMFIRVEISGPELCTLTFHLRDQLVPGSTARRMLTAACEWLLTRNVSRQGFIELESLSDNPLQCAAPAAIM